MSQNDQNLVWIDLEMTGLEPDADYIIEIATIVTDVSLDILAEGPVLSIRQSDEILSGMDEWNTRQHAESGLTERVRNSPYDEAQAERLTLEFVRRYVPAGKSPLCGNSICQDRRFLSRFMPELEAYFHYRNLDVSTLKELCMRWSPNLCDGFTKSSSHRALQDIRESIDELKYYRQHFLKL